MGGVHPFTTPKTIRNAEIVYQYLSEIVREGGRAPSNPMLTELVGDTSADHIYHVFKLLRKTGRVHIEKNGKLRRRFFLPNVGRTEWNVGDGNAKADAKTPRLCLQCLKIFKSDAPKSIDRICPSCENTEAYSAGADMVVGV